MFKFWKSAQIAFALCLLAVSTVNSKDRVPEDPRSAQRVISSQLDAFHQRDHAKAYSFAAPNVKTMFGNVDSFINAVKHGGYLPIYNNSTYSFGKSRLFDGDIYQEVSIIDRNGKQWQAIYTLRQQANGFWKITGAYLQEIKGTAT